jgi:dipeptidyl aminopeptidase/acylaminoacyl peptidase
VTGQATRVQIETADEPLNGLLVRPRRAERGAILFGPAAGQSPESYAWLVDPLVEAGYSVLALYLRGVGSVGAGDVLGPVDQTDFLASLAYLRRQVGDSQGIAVGGHSLGAGLALMASADSPAPAACIALAPRVDWLEYMRWRREADSPIYEREVQRIGKGQHPEENEAPYYCRSAIYVAERITVPVFLLVGATDQMNPPDNVYRMGQRLRDTGNRDVTEVVVPECGHWFRNRAAERYEHETIVRQTLAWLEPRLG